MNSQSFEIEQIKYNYITTFLTKFNISKNLAKININSTELQVLFNNYHKKYPCEYPITESEFSFIVTSIL